MRHPLFKAGIFTALIKNRDFRPLSLVLASMHSYLFYKEKECLVFVRFHLFFLCELNKYCMLFSVCCLYTRNHIFSVSILGTAGN